MTKLNEAHHPTLRLTLLDDEVWAAAVEAYKTNRAIRVLLEIHPTALTQVPNMLEHVPGGAVISRMGNNNILEGVYSVIPRKKKVKK